MAIFKTLTIRDVVDNHPLEINGLLIDAEVTMTLKKDSSGNIEIDSQDIGDLFVVGDFISVPLLKGGAQYHIICKKFEHLIGMKAVEVAGKTSEHKWTVIEDLEA